MSAHRWMVLSLPLLLWTSIAWSQVPVADYAQVPSADYATDSIICDQAPKLPSAITPTTLRFHCGPTTRQYTYHVQEVSLPLTRRLLKDVLPEPGLAFCMCTAAAVGEESGPSPELAFYAAPPADIEAPVVTISSPAPKSTVAQGAIVPVILTTDAEDITAVFMFVNKESICGPLTRPPWSCPWTVPHTPKARAYTIEAGARDASGNATLSKPVQVKSDGPD